jgi:hypothetical protein
MADSDVEMGSAADIGNRRLRMDQELATATRGRVQLVLIKFFNKTNFQRRLTSTSNFPKPFKKAISSQTELKSSPEQYIFPIVIS